LTSDKGAPLYLFANDAITLTTITGDKSAFTEASVEFELQNGTDLTIGVVGGNDDGSYTADGYYWYKTDNFQLTYVDALKLTVNVEQEYTYDTIILPFDHAVPDGYEIYSINGCADDNNQVMKLTRVYDIAANTPYVIKRTVSKKVHTRGESSDTSTGVSFTGIPTNDADSYTDGMLTGTFTDTTLEAGDYALNSTTEKFELVTEEDNVTLSAYHAYIDTTSLESENIDTTSVSTFGMSDPSVTTGIDAVMFTANATVDVYNIGGTKVRSGVAYSNALNGLAPGIYMVRCGNYVEKIAHN
jgi:hypothetical protein